MVMQCPKTREGVFEPESSARVRRTAGTGLTVLLPETLPPEKRSALKLRSLLPDSFLRIFTAAAPARLAGVRAKPDWKE